MTGGAQLVNPRILLPRKIRLISLMGLMVIVSRDLGSLERNSILTQESINNIRPIDTMGNDVIVLS